MFASFTASPVHTTPGVLYVVMKGYKAQTYFLFTISFCTG